MFQRPEAPKQLIKLGGRPLLQDLHKYADQSIKVRNKGLNLCWNSADNSCGYGLTIICESSSMEPQWRMSSQAGPTRKDLWFYVSSDINKIFSMMIASIGEDLAQAYAADTQQQKETHGGVKATAIPTISASFGMARDGPTVQRMPAVAAIASPSELLTGNLALLHVTNLLQSIAMGKMTGRLHIDPDSGPVEIFFEMGMPVHALSRLSSGEECFLEVVALHNGSFVFEPNLKTDTRSITHALDSLILKGVQLVDCQSVIEGAGVKSNSIVHRAQQGLGEAEFEDKVRQGAPLDMTIQKRFYITIDERLSIKQIADSLKLLRSEWVPIIANFIKVDLASFSDSDPNAKRLTVARKRIDPIVVEQFAHHLKKPDTGAFTFPAFLYFLEQEFLRFTHHQAPVSVILLDIRLNKAGAPAPAPRTAMNAQMMNPQTVNPQAVAHVVRCMVPAKRELDLIAHYEGQSLAILLPNTEWREAADVARRILAALSEARITTGLEKLNVSGVLGVACLPKDVDNPGELLAAAELAKERASTAPDGLRLFSDLS